MKIMFKKFLLVLIVYTSVTSGQIETTVYRDIKKGASGEKLLGMNIRKRLDPGINHNKYYQESFFYISPQFIRLHTTETWYDSKQHGQGWAEGRLMYTANIDGSELVSGQYQLYLSGEDFSASRSLTLIKYL